MKEIWDFFWEQIIPIIGLKNFAVIEFLVIVAILAVTKYFSDKETKSHIKEIAIKDSTIQSLNIELENLKPYPTSLLVQNLGQHVKEYEVELARLNEKLRNLNKEVETETRKKSVIEQEKAEIQKQLNSAQLDALNLKKRLEQLEYELDVLLGARAEPDICRVCDVDDEHILMNTIYWGGKSGRLIGDTDLVEEGVCSYCASLNLKCKVCGAITGIDASAADVIECEGCYETLYTPLTFFGKRSDDKIKVSRLVSE